MTDFSQKLGSIKADLDQLSTSLSQVDGKVESVVKGFSDLADQSDNVKTLNTTVSDLRVLLGRIDQSFFDELRIKVGELNDALAHVNKSSVDQLTNSFRDQLAVVRELTKDASRLQTTMKNILPKANNTVFSDLLPELKALESELTVLKDGLTSLRRSDYFSSITRDALKFNNTLDKTKTSISDILIEADKLNNKIDSIASSRPTTFWDGQKAAAKDYYDYITRRERLRSTRADSSVAKIPKPSTESSGSASFIASSQSSQSNMNGSVSNNGGNIFQNIGSFLNQFSDNIYKPIQTFTSQFGAILNGFKDIFGGLKNGGLGGILDIIKGGTKIIGGGQVLDDQFGFNLLPKALKNSVGQGRTGIINDVLTAGYNFVRDQFPELDLPETKQKEEINYANKLKKRTANLEKLLNENEVKTKYNEKATIDEVANINKLTIESNKYTQNNEKIPDDIALAIKQSGDRLIALAKRRKELLKSRERLEIRQNEVIAEYNDYLSYDAGAGPAASFIKIKRPSSSHDADDEFEKLYEEKQRAERKSKAERLDKDWQGPTVRDYMQFAITDDERSASMRAQTALLSATKNTGLEKYVNQGVFITDSQNGKNALKGVHNENIRGEYAAVSMSNLPGSRDSVVSINKNANDLSQFQEPKLLHELVHSARRGEGLMLSAQNDDQYYRTRDIISTFQKWKGSTPSIGELADGSFDPSQTGSYLGESAAKYHLSSRMEKGDITSKEYDELTKFIENNRSISASSSGIQSTASFDSALEEVYANVGASLLTANKHFAETMRIFYGDELFSAVESDLKKTLPDIFSDDNISKVKSNSGQLEDQLRLSIAESNGLPLTVDGHAVKSESSNSNPVGQDSVDSSTSVLESLKHAFTDVSGVIDSLIRDIINNIKNGLIGIRDSSINTFGSIGFWIKKQASNIYNSVKENQDKQNLESSVSNYLDFIEKKPSNIFSKDGIDQFKNLFKDLMSVLKAEDDKKYNNPSSPHYGGYKEANLIESNGTNSFKSIFDYIGYGAKNVGNYIQTIFKGVSGFLSRLVEVSVNSFGSTVHSIKMKINDILKENATNDLKKSLSDYGEFVKSNPSEVGKEEGLKKLENLIDKFDSVMNRYKQPWQNSSRSSNLIESTDDKVGGQENSKSSLDNLWDYISKGASNVSNVAQDIFKNVSGFINNIRQYVIDLFSSAKRSVLSTVDSIQSNVDNNRFKQSLSGYVDFVSNNPDKIADEDGMNLLKDLLNSYKSLLNREKNKYITTRGSANFVESAANENLGSANFITSSANSQNNNPQSTASDAKMFVANLLKSAGFNNFDVKTVEFFDSVTSTVDTVSSIIGNGIDNLLESITGSNLSNGGSVVIDNIKNSMIGKVKDYLQPFDKLADIDYAGIIKDAPSLNQGIQSVGKKIYQVYEDKIKEISENILTPDDIEDIPYIINRFITPKSLKRNFLPDIINGALDVGTDDRDVGSFGSRMVSAGSNIGKIMTGSLDLRQEYNNAIGRTVASMFGNGNTYQQRLFTGLGNLMAPQGINQDDIINRLRYKSRMSLGEDIDESTFSMDSSFDFEKNTNNITASVRSASGALLNFNGKIDEFNDLVEDSEKATNGLLEMTQDIFKELPRQIAEEFIQNIISTMQELFTSIINVQDELGEIATLSDAPTPEDANRIQSQFFFRSVQAAGKTGNTTEEALQTNIQNFKVLGSIKDTDSRSAIASSLSELQLGAQSAFGISLEESLSSLPAIFAQIRDSIPTSATDKLGKMLDLTDPAHRSILALEEMQSVMDKLVVAQRESGATGADLIQVYSSLASSADKVGLSQNQLISLSSIASVGLGKAPAETSNALKAIIERTYGEGKAKLEELGISYKQITEDGKIVDKNFLQIFDESIQLANKSPQLKQQISNAFGGRAYANDVIKMMNARDEGIRIEGRLDPVSQGGSLEGREFEGLVEKRTANVTGAINQLQLSIGSMIETVFFGSGAMSDFVDTIGRLSDVMGALASVGSQNTEPLRILKELIYNIIGGMIGVFTKGMNIFSGLVSTINSLTTKIRAGLNIVKTGVEGALSPITKAGSAIKQVIGVVASEGTGAFQDFAKSILGASSNIHVLLKAVQQLPDEFAAVKAAASGLENAMGLGDSRKVAPGVSSFWETENGKMLKSATKNVSSLAFPIGYDLAIGGLEADNLTNMGVAIAGGFIGMAGGPAGAEVGYMIARTFADSVDIYGLFDTSKTEEKSFARQFSRMSQEDRQSIYKLVEDPNFVNSDTFKNAKSLTGDNWNNAFGLIPSERKQYEQLDKLLKSDPKSLTKLQSIYQQGIEERNRVAGITSTTSDGYNKRMLNAGAGSSAASSLITSEINKLMPADRITGKRDELSNISLTALKALIDAKGQEDPSIAAFQKLRNFTDTTDPEELRKLILRTKDVEDPLYKDLVDMVQIEEERSAWIASQKGKMDTSGNTDYKDNTTELLSGIPSSNLQPNAPVKLNQYGFFGSGVQGLESNYIPILNKQIVSGDTTSDASNQFSEKVQSLTSIPDILAKIDTVAPLLNQSSKGLEQSLVNMGSQGQSLFSQQLDTLIQMLSVVQEYEKIQERISAIQSNPDYLSGTGDNYDKLKENLSALRDRESTLKSSADAYKPYLDLIQKDSQLLVKNASVLEKQNAVRTKVVGGTKAQFAAPSTMNVEDYSSDSLNSAIQYAIDKQNRYIAMNPEYQKQFAADQFLMESGDQMRGVTGVNQGFVNEYLQKQQSKLQVPDMVDMSKFNDSEREKILARARDLQGQAVALAPDLADKYTDERLIIQKQGNKLMSELGLSQEYLKMAIDENTKTNEDMLRGHYNLPSNYQTPTIWDYYNDGGREQGNVNYVRPGGDGTVPMDFARNIAQEVLNSQSKESGGPNLNDITTVSSSYARPLFYPNPGSAGTVVEFPDDVSVGNQNVGTLTVQNLANQAMDQRRSSRNTSNTDDGSDMRGPYVQNSKPLVNAYDLDTPWKAMMGETNAVTTPADILKEGKGPINLSNNAQKAADALNQTNQKVATTGNMFDQFGQKATQVVSQLGLNAGKAASSIASFGFNSNELTQSAVNMTAGITAGGISVQNALIGLASKIAQFSLDNMIKNGTVNVTVNGQNTQQLQTGSNSPVFGWGAASSTGGTGLNATAPSSQRQNGKLGMG